MNENYLAIAKQIQNLTMVIKDIRKELSQICNELAIINERNYNNDNSD